jgi:hypothetical protein
MRRLLPVLLLKIHSAVKFFLLGHDSSAPPGNSSIICDPKPATAALGDAELADLIEDIHDVFPGYGHRRNRP